jgi:hypothetical protein
MTDNHEVPRRKKPFSTMRKAGQVCLPRGRESAGISSFAAGKARNYIELHGRLWAGQRLLKKVAFDTVLKPGCSVRSMWPDFNSFWRLAG